VEVEVEVEVVLVDQLALVLAVVEAVLVLRECGLYLRGI
jgi:hypothetical protein